MKKIQKKNGFCKRNMAKLPITRCFIQLHRQLGITNAPITRRQFCSLKQSLAIFQLFKLFKLFKSTIQLTVTVFFINYNYSTFKPLSINLYRFTILSSCWRNPTNELFRSQPFIRVFPITLDRIPCFVRQPTTNKLVG